MIKGFDTDCSFCNEIMRYPENNMFLKYFQEHINNGLKNRVVYETKNFCVMPTLGPLTEGHLLILPKRHCFSYACISRLEYKEFEHIKLVVKKLLTNVYCHPIFFEHGSMSKTLKGGNTYDHAHMHAIPLNINIDINEELSRLDFAPRKISFTEELAKQRERRIPYLFFEDQNARKTVCDALTVESQFIRKLLAKRTGKHKNMYWQQDLNIELLVSTLNKLRIALRRFRK